MSNVDKIKERLDIVEVVGGYVKLEKAGSNFKAKCPFHSERTPSFFVSPGRNSYYCFGCGAKGDIFTFVEEFEGLDFLGALKVLADRAGVSLEFENKGYADEKEKLFQILEEATTFFSGQLKENKEALAYLSKRGVKEKDIKEWRLGFAPASWRTILTKFKGKNFKEDELLKAGLIKKSDDAADFYDVFRSRIIFPIFDSAARSIAFSGRSFPDSGNAPKYLNSPETILFNKSETLYGLHIAKSAIRKKNYSILVEGQMDLILSHSAGFDNTVATSGTALSSYQLERLSKLSERIVFAYDGDSAGFAAVERAAKMGLSMGMNIRVVPVPAKEDPASIIVKNPSEWLTLLQKSSHIIDFYLDKLLAAKMEKRRLDREISSKILPFIKLLPSQIEQSRFIAEVAEKAGLKEEAVWQDLKKIKEEGGTLNTVDKEVLSINAKISGEEISRSRIYNTAAKIMGIIFWQEKLKNRSIDTKIIEERLKELVGETEFKPFLELPPFKKEELLFEAETYYENKDNLEMIVDDLLLSLEESLLKGRFAEIVKKLGVAERDNNKEAATKLLIECKEIGQKINDLNNKKTKIF